jgi:hypothetical protein
VLDNRPQKRRTPCQDPRHYQTIGCKHYAHVQIFLVSA